MKTLLAVAAVVIPLSGAFAQIAEGYGHHLEPEPSAFDSYDPEYAVMLSTVFKELFEPSVLARALALPHNSSEYSVGIKQVQQEYKLFGLRSREPLVVYVSLTQWKRELESASVPDFERASLRRRIEILEMAVPADYHDVGISRCEVGLDPQLGTRIVELWRKMLLQTRYTDQSAGTVLPLTLHGTSYHFSSGGMAGTAPYIAQGSNLDLFVNLADTMYSLCSTVGTRDPARLSSDVDALLLRLQQ